MAFGGGGTADYQANLILNTGGAERTLQVFGGKMARALNAVGKNMNANVGQSLRETDRALVKLNNQLADLRARAQALTPAQKQQASAALQATRAVSKQRQALSDLSRQGRATSRDMKQLAKALEAAAQATPPVRGRAGVAANLNKIASDIRARAKQNPGAVPTTQPLTKTHLRNAEYMDALAERQKFNKLWTESVAKQFDAEQGYADRIAAARAKQANDVKALNARAQQASLDYVSSQQATDNKERAEKTSYIQWWSKVLDQQDRLIAREEQQAMRRQRAAMASLAAPFKGATSATITSKRGGILGRLGMTKTSNIGGIGGGKPPRKGGRTSGGGHGGFETPDGKERGQLMPTRSKAAAKALLGLSSAAQGAMLGMAALQGSVTGVGFSLIFLGYGVVSVALAFAALTVAAAVTQRFFKMVITQGAKAGAAMEQLGQQMTSWFKDQARAQADLSKASKFSQTFGIDPEAARQAVFTLDKMGMATDGYLNAVADAAAGTGKAVTDVTDQWMAIQKADAADREGLMKQFAKDFDIQVKNYGSSLEVMTALNERWGGSGKAAAETQLGMIARIKATWTDFMTSVGSVLQGFFKPVLTMALAFTQAMNQGFNDAKKAGMETGDLQHNMDNFAATVIKITPYMVKFGYVMGKVVYYGLLIVAKVVKVVADTLIRLWNKIKPVVDTIRAWIPKIKELIDNIITWYQKNKDLIDTLAAILLGLALFEGGSRILLGVLNALWNMVGAVGDAIVGLGKLLANTNLVKAAKLSLEGLEAVLQGISKVAQALAGLTNKVIGLGLAGFNEAMNGLGRIKDALNDIKDKITNINNNPVNPAGAPSTTGGGGLKLPGIDWKGALPSAIGQFADEAAILLGRAITLLASHPLVLAAVAVVSAVILAGLFPKETGIITSHAADIAGAVLIALATSLAIIPLQLVNVWVDITAILVKGAITAFIDIVKGVAGVVLDVGKSVFGGIVDILAGILTLDFPRIVDGAKTILTALFVDLPVGLLTVFGDAAKNMITTVVPAIGEALYNAMKAILDPLLSQWSIPWDNIWNWMQNWWEQFNAGWVTEKWDSIKKAFQVSLDAIWQSFKDIFDFSGSKAIGKMISDAFTSIKNALDFMPNPFGRIMDLMDDVMDKAGRLGDALNAVLPGNPFGGSGGGGSSSGGGTPQNQRTWVPAQVIDWSYQYGKDPATGAQIVSGGTYKIRGSHWSDTQGALVDVFTSGVQYPDLSKYALGGRVPGRPGTKVPVLADAGEVFLGRPNLAQGSGREAAALGGRGDINITIDARESVMTNDVMQKIADTVASALGGQLAGNRRMSFHRIG